MKLSNKQTKKQASKNKKCKKNTAKQTNRQITGCLSNMCGYNFDKFIQNNFNENI